MIEHFEDTLRVRKDQSPIGDFPCEPARSPTAGPFGDREVALTHASVGQLLRGLPWPLVDAVDIGDVWSPLYHSPAWHRQVGDRIRRDRAAALREAAIARIVGQVGWSDHGRCWALGRQVVAVEGRPYGLDAADLAELDWLTRTWNLTVRIDASSDYMPSWTCRVLLSRPDAPSSYRRTGGSR